MGTNEKLTPDEARRRFLKGELTAEDLAGDPGLLAGFMVLMRQHIDSLQHRVASLSRHTFGRRSERFHNPDQGLLFESQLNEVIGKALELNKELKDKAKGEKGPKEPRNQARRQPLPADLPRIKESHELTEEKLAHLTGGKAMKLIGWERLEKLCRLEVCFVHETMCAIYAGEDDDSGVVTTPAPDQVVDKGNFDRSFLAAIVTGKYQDHLPLYRQAEIYKREGITLPLSTLCDQVTFVADLLAPIHRQVLTEIKARPWIQVDESPVRTAMGKGKGKKTKKAWIWLYHSGPGLVHFTWAASREGQHARETLADYQGYVQTDDYAGYDQLHSRGDVVEVGCMVHARRFFDKALGDNKQYASLVLGLIQELYAIEDKLPKGEDQAEERLRVRQEKAVPILESLHEWLITHKELTTPQSLIGKAIEHMLNRWEALTRYTTDGRLHIDNNPAENIIRLLAVGRKNWLQFGSEEGGRRSATLLSLVAGCRSLGIDPRLYFWDVLARVSQCPATQIHDLTPLGWKERYMEEAGREYAQWRTKMMAGLAPKK